MKIMKIIIIVLVILSWSTIARAEDGYRLWLRAKTNANAQVAANKQGKTINVAIQELKTQWIGAPVQLNIVTTKDVVVLGVFLCPSISEGILIKLHSTSPKSN